MIRGRISGEIIWVAAPKSELQSKVGVAPRKAELQPDGPQKSEPNCPDKAPEWGLGASTETHP